MAIQFNSSFSHTHHLAHAMATATMDAGATAARVDSAAMGNTTAAICDLIQEHRYHGTMSGRQAAAISAMIDDLAATAAAEGRPRTTGRRRKRRMGSSRWYQDLAKLGRGSYGVVFRARHRATGQCVAVKYARPGSGSDVHDLLREACFMAACQGHPSLVGFRGVARAPGTAGEYSLVMDYVGPSLSVVLWDRRLRPFPEADVRRVMRQLLAGAEAMHERGVVHRDIKPANILVGDGGGVVKICDFGSAKSMDEEWPTYIAGTIPYMAPEVLLYNDEHGAPVDAWSLGCVMAELLTGDLLFAGEDEADQLHKIFDVLGVPGKKAWQALKPQLFADEVQQWRARQRRVAQRSRLRELVPEDLLSKEGFEVLKGLLTCDPKKRLTASAALRRPWFTDSVDDGDARAPATTAVSTVGGAATKKWSLVSVLPALALKMAMSFLRRPLGLLRPNALLN